MPPELFFPPLSGGLEQGLNNAGIETFEGNIQRHIVRECTQNALDARARGSKQVQVEIQLRQIPAVQVPALSALRSAIQSARNYWCNSQKTVDFCQKAIGWTNGNSITVLEVSDYGTTGLEGGDGDRDKSWFGLVQSSGVAIKPPDAAGAFGIGKDAPFAGSFIRTVLYSSLNQAGQAAFQGVTKLTTHTDSKGQKTQDVGFIGHVSAAEGCRAVRDHAQIPEPFRRTQVGTSLFIVAYRYLGSDEWTEGFVREAVENFWPAIHRGSLTFQIGNRRVDGRTLPALMSRYSSEPEFVSRFHYRAVTAAPNRIEHQTLLLHLGACRLYLVAGDATYPKTICMTRQTGMVIYEANKFRSYRPFAGLFICESAEGNAYLRQLEPPRHDKWDATRLDDQAEAKGVLQNVRNWINECLRELNPDDNTQEADVPELNRYLPDEEDEPLAEDADSAAKRSGEDGIVVRPISAPLSVQIVPPRPPASSQTHGPESPSDGQEAGEGLGRGQIDPNKKETQSPGRHGNTSGGGATGPNVPRAVKVLLQTRSVRSGLNTYDLIVRSANACEGRLVLTSVGEDNHEDKGLRILSVADLNSQTAITLDTFSLEPGQTARLRVTIDSPVPLSLRAYCHGN